MLKKEIAPTPYQHKLPMQFKNYDIFFNKDLHLAKIPPNQHNYYEFYFLISGAVDYYIENRKYSLNSGDIILISPNQTHSAFINPSVPYERYVLWLSVHYMETLSSDRTNLSAIFQASYIAGQQITLPREVFLHLQQLLNYIFVNSKAKNYGADLLANAYIIELLILLAQASLFCADKRSTHGLAEPQSQDFSLILKVLKYIEDHICSPISIDEICACCFMSRSHLSKIFCAQLGLPLHQYILKKRLFLAKQDIRDGLPIQEVTGKYGFQNYSAFYKAFCKEFGQNPKSFKPKKDSKFSPL